MGAKLSCVKRQHRSRASNDNTSGLGAASAQNQQHPGGTAVQVPTQRRVVVSQNGTQIIRRVRSLDHIVITCPTTDLKTLILDTLRLLRGLVGK